MTFFGETHGSTERRPRWPCGAAGLVLAAALAFGPGDLAAARQATPASAPNLPRPDACQIAPRLPPLLLPAAAGAPAATPLPLPLPTAATPPTGEPAGSAVAEAETATVRESIACRNAGDDARVYALMTDQMLVRLFGGRATIDPVVAEALAAAPDRLPRPQRLAAVAVADARLLPDSRAAARVETRNQDETFADELIFVERGGRWQIDDAIAVTSSARRSSAPAGDRSRARP